MKNKMGNSALFRQYFFVTSLIILLSFIILGSSMFFFGAKYWAGDKERLMSENAKNIAQTTAELVESGETQTDGRNSVRIICNMLSTISSSIDSDIFICNLKGEVVYCQHILKQDMVIFTGECPIHGSYHIPDDNIKKVVSDGSYVEITKLGGLFQNYNFVVADPITTSYGTIGFVYATQPIFSSMKTFFLTIAKVFLFSALLALLISCASAYFMTYQLTRPLREMSAATKKYSEGDFSYRVAITGKGELTDLSIAFNAMATALATLESTRRSFVANVSHELKTPMTTIGGFIDGVLDGTISQDKRNHYLKIVSDEVKRLSRLVTGMLNMSKIEAGELTIKPVKFDISEMVFKTTLAFEQLIEKKNIEIQGLDSISSILIDADEDMINQVIYNLIDNAVKFTPNEGTITFRVVTDAEKVIVRIKNTGVGISSEEIGRIFERFYKVDKSRSYDVKGAGLGLFLVKSIIEMHGGQISAVSVENKFTEFIFWLPIL